VIILSGLALGIDGLAHITALKHNLITLAVPGSGLDSDVLYPATHKNLAKDILEHNGVLISELDPTTQASPWTFPQRNRIMASLSDALLIIEAEEKSGTLITARQALELGRDIGAVPGEIFSPTSAGPNMLIHEGAYPISKAEDLLALLHLSSQQQSDHEAIVLSTSHLSGNEIFLLDLIREPTDKDTLFQKSKLLFPDFVTAFSSLEINGYIEESFGEVRRIV
jgi:DNA processing protein